MNIITNNENNQKKNSEIRKSNLDVIQMTNDRIK